MRSVFRHAAVYGIGTLLGRVASFLMLPVYTRYLTPEDYGVMTLIDMTLDVMAILAGTQLVLGVFRFYHKEDKEEERRKVVSTAFISLGVSYVVVSSIGIVSAKWLSLFVFGSYDNTGLIRLASATLFTQSLAIVPLALARVRDQSSLYVISNLIRLVLTIALNILFVVFLEMGVAGMFLSGLLASSLVGGWLSVWLVRQVGVGLAVRHFRDLARYGIPMAGVQIATFTATFADRAFLQATGDTAGVGLYNMAYQFGFILSAIGFGPFAQVWGPKRFQVAKLPDRDKRFSEAFLFINMWVLWLAVAISLFIDDFFHVMTTDEFFQGARYVHLILIAFIFQIWATLQDVGILVRERTQLLTLATGIAAVVGLAAFAVLIPRFGPMGAAAGTILSFATRWALTFGFSQHVWPVKYDWKPVLRLLAMAVSVAVIGRLLPSLPLVQSVAVRSLLLVGFTVMIWHGGVLAGEDKLRLLRVGREVWERVGRLGFAREHG